MSDHTDSNAAASPQIITPKRERWPLKGDVLAIVRCGSRERQGARAVAFLRPNRQSRAVLLIPAENVDDALFPIGLAVTCGVSALRHLAATAARLADELESGGR